MARRTRDYWGQVDEDIYNELGNRATQEGLKIRDLINRYIVEGLQGDAGNEDSNLDSEIFLAVQKARAKERRFVLLEQVGATAIKGSDQDLDDFASLCAKANASVDEILERIKQQRHPHSLPSFDDGTGVRSAVGWLQDLFNDIEGEKKRIGSRELEELGAKAGFSWPTLKAAKQHLSIKSMREGMKWYWVLLKG